MPALEHDADATKADSGAHGSLVVQVNTRPVTLIRHRLTGLEIKRAAIAQGVEIQEDFLLTVEANGGQPARTVDDDELITITKHSVFTANTDDEDA